MGESGPSLEAIADVIESTSGVLGALKNKLVSDERISQISKTRLNSAISNLEMIVQDIKFRSR